MATKKHAALAKRVKALVEESGGEKEFSRRVWPRDRPGANKGKVWKWCTGNSGMDVAEAERVATALGRRPAWLLFGEEPERPGTSRTAGSLAQDLEAEVLARLVPTFADEEAAQWVPASIGGLLKSKITGRRMLDLLVELAKREYFDNAAWFARAYQRRRGLLLAMKYVTEAPDTKAAPREKAEAIAALRELYLGEQDDRYRGELIVWEEDELFLIINESLPGLADISGMDDPE